MSEFDAYASDYETALNQGLAVSGEGKDFFAQGRINWLAHCLISLGLDARRTLDYGCGTGSATPFFFELLKTQHVLGVDLSERSLEVARRDYGARSTRFATLSDYQPDQSFDLAFCNGVFHHIPLAEQPGCMKYVFDSLRPGGVFAFWENSPWNPGTRYIMSRIPFDRDAILVWAGEAQRLARAAGFVALRTDYCFVFPKSLSFLRGVEPYLVKLPLGAQYQILFQKPVERQ